MSPHLLGNITNKGILACLAVSLLCICVVLGIVSFFFLMYITWEVAFNLPVA